MKLIYKYKKFSENKLIDHKTFPISEKDKFYISDLFLEVADKYHMRLGEYNTNTNDYIIYSIHNSYDAYINGKKIYTSTDSGTLSRYESMIMNIVGEFTDELYNDILKYCNRLRSFDYLVDWWKPGFTNIRIHISTKESNPFLKNLDPF